MQTIYKGDFCEYTFQQENDLLVGRWFNTDQMTQDVFKEELLRGELFAIEQCKPSTYLVDTSNFELPITPETQKWMAEHLTISYVQNGVKKVAFLRSHTFVAQLSIQQSNDETVNREVEKQHFSDEKEALTWLKS